MSKEYQSSKSILTNDENNTDSKPDDGRHIDPEKLFASARQIPGVMIERAESKSTQSQSEQLEKSRQP